jgi:poly-gamma-glutamate capsule biosynthesis protein CapA/YwtB (metallophosphatase superfamily)
MFSLAGNHAGDAGQKGYESTINLLKNEGLGYTGTGNTDNAKIFPAIYEMNGRKIGLIAADTVSSYYWNKGSKSYGTNWFSNSMNENIDMNRVKMVTDLKAENKIDYLIVYMSWGVEYTNKATKFQVDLAHALIDSGADMIVASHPHWVQNVEFYKDKPIFYALGNFLFDQNHTDPTREGVVLNFHFFNHELKSIDIEPHISCGPYITNKDITNDYLAGKVSLETIQTNNEKNGCVYFQPKKLLETDNRYKEVMDRLFQYTVIK